MSALRENDDVRAVHENDVVVDGQRIRVLSAGAGPTVVLVHGLGLGAGFWRFHLESLAASGYRAVAPDMPGFGRTGGPAFAFTVEHAAGWLAEFADRLDMRHAVWVGHSVSAQYVLRLAVVRPDLVRGLVLAAPTGEPGAFRWLGQLIGLARTAPRERPRFVAHVLRHYLTTPPTRVFGAWLGARRHMALDDAPLVRCPVRVVLGGRDPVVPRAFADRLVAAAPMADLVVVPESAHGVALAPAAPFCRVLLDFLARFPHPAVDRSTEPVDNPVETT